MELIPAIDVLAGKAVRLERGRYDRVTVYAEDPIEPAARFRDAGARRLHVVDLDGARDGAPRNVSVIERLVGVADVALQIGGGIRDARTVEHWLSAGAARVVLGTAAVADPGLVRDLCTRYPGRIVVALDARAGEVQVEGWLTSSGRRVPELAKDADAWGAAAILHTSIERDGTGAGPDVEGTVELQRLVSTTVIASGGIGTLAHVRRLAAAGVVAAVCGRALLSGVFTIEQALAAAAGDG